MYNTARNLHGTQLMPTTPRLPLPFSQISEHLDSGTGGRGRWAAKCCSRRCRKPVCSHSRVRWRVLHRGERVCRVNAVGFRFHKQACTNTLTVSVWTFFDTLQVILNVYGCATQNSVRTYLMKACLLTNYTDKRRLSAKPPPGRRHFVLCIGTLYSRLRILSSRDLLIHRCDTEPIVGSGVANHSAVTDVIVFIDCSTPN